MTDKVTAAMYFLTGITGCPLTHLDWVYAGTVDLRNLSHKLAKDSGWWDNTPADAINGAVKIALIHSEVSEALEGLRKGKQDDHLPHRLSVEVELADAVIRIMDLAGALDLDLAGAIIEKLAYNQQRADHKKENRDADGGKKF